MAKPLQIELPGGELMPILYEDRSLLAVDKPYGWLLAPEHWRKTSRNLQMALRAALQERAFWARARNLKFLRYVHRLDADTTGVLLLAKSPGALTALSALFERRKVEKVYLAVVNGCPQQQEWTCRLKLGPDPSTKDKIAIAPLHGLEAETRFRLLLQRHQRSLVEARPRTGRTHQIRIHLAAAGHPVLGDPLYGNIEQPPLPLALRAIAVSYSDPFTRRRVHIHAPGESFVERYGFGAWTPDHAQ